MSNDFYNLNRFLKAQEGSYDDALKELCRGKKQGHWMWFIFPQIVGLGSSDQSVYYSIKSLEEAKAFLNHPVLGVRLEECVEVVLEFESVNISDLFGHPDDVKFRSCMTLFGYITNSDSLYNQVLDQHLGGKRDDSTIGIMNAII